MHPIPTRGDWRSSGGEPDDGVIGDGGPGFSRKFIVVLVIDRDISQRVARTQLFWSDRNHPISLVITVSPWCLHIAHCWSTPDGYLAS